MRVGVGYLQVNADGLRLEGDSDFLFHLHAQKIDSREDSALLVHSSENVTLSARNTNGDVTGSVSVGQARSFGQHFNISSNHDENIFYADGNGAIVGKGKLCVTGPEGALFEHSVRTPLVKEVLNKELKLESPTCSLIMDAPKGVHAKALAGNVDVTANFDILLHSTAGLESKK
ncbi:gamma-sarcoglycan-like isoform X1 [Myxocyprinus asiaticus]|uniref:gamma-sarcoglycan-like isoform X1 n=1 Tax=Myxocyprinus asiaticus TaxID=70543 RepID=UPI002221B4D2|nr:gamma-sarcoglycan-like isoform X1 [Myxocyprinus asiaticus]XP_051521096.1 gamma-sarcoglycan-like isoform X1 [Myxocyprinus asiaticus]